MGGATLRCPAPTATPGYPCGGPNGKAHETTRVIVRVADRGLPEMKYPGMRNRCQSCATSLDFFYAPSSDPIRA